MNMNKPELIEIITKKGNISKEAAKNFMSEQGYKQVPNTVLFMRNHNI